MTPEEKLDLADTMLRRFRGQPDRVAAQVAGGTFNPLPLREPLSPRQFADTHLSGAVCYGLYPLLDDETCLCACVDFDNHAGENPAWRDQAVALANWLEVEGVSCLIEVSQSGEGAHVWLFFDEAVPAWVVRDFLRQACAAAQVPCKEIYPRQSHFPADGKRVGNLVRYPLWNRSKFVDPAGADLDPNEAVDGTRQVQEAWLREVAGAKGWTLRDEPAAAASAPEVGRNGTATSGADAGLHPEIAAAVRDEPRSLLARRWHGDVTGLNDPSRSGLSFAIACELIRRCYATDTIRTAVKTWMEANGGGEKATPRWLNLTLKNAYQDVRLRPGVKAEAARRGPVPEPSPFRDPPPEANGVYKPEDTELKPTDPVLLCLDDVTPKEAKFLWPGRLPENKMVTFAGSPGLGKTFVLCDIAVRLAHGLPWPDGAGVAPVGKTIFISGEDAADDTILPRMIEQGYRVGSRMIHTLNAKASGCFTLQALHILDRARHEMGDGLRFVVIDPPTSYLGGINDHKNSELRTLLTPISDWCGRRRVCLVFNTHFNKGGAPGADAALRIIGGIAWNAAVRVTHVFAEDGDDRTRRLFIPKKINNGALEKGLAYRIVPTAKLAKLEWLGTIEQTADEAIENQPRRRRDVNAAEWLVDRFNEKLEWDSKDLFKAASEAGVSRSSIFEAKDLLRLPKAQKRTALNGDQSWWWVVPHTWERLRTGQEPREEFREGAEP